MKEQILFNISLQNISVMRSSAHYFASRILVAAYLESPASEQRQFCFRDVLTLFAPPLFEVIKCHRGELVSVLAPL